MLSFPQLRAEALAPKLRRITRDLWEDGLAEPALAAVRLAAEQGVPDAPEALADLERNGGTSVTARAIVRRLAASFRGARAYR